METQQHQTEKCRDDGYRVDPEDDTLFAQSGG
jgi:hypothetical protein